MLFASTWSWQMCYLSAVSGNLFRQIILTGGGGDVGLDTEFAVLIFPIIVTQEIL